MNDFFSISRFGSLWVKYYRDNRAFYLWYVVLLIVFFLAFYAWAFSVTVSDPKTHARVFMAALFLGGVAEGILLNYRVTSPYAFNRKTPDRLNNILLAASNAEKYFFIWLNGTLIPVFCGWLLLWLFNWIAGWCVPSFPVYFYMDMKLLLKDHHTMLVLIGFLLFFFNLISLTRINKTYNYLNGTVFLLYMICNIKGIRMSDMLPDAAWHVVTAHTGWILGFLCLGVFLLGYRTFCRIQAK